MQSFDFKKIRLDVLIIIGFAVLALFFCYPQLQGKKLVQTDNISWQGMAREGMAYHDSTGKDVLWTNSIFGGMPSYTIYVAAKTTDLIAYIQNIIQALGKPAYFFFLAMLSFFILMRVLNVNRWLAAIGGIAYAFSTFNPTIVFAGHETQMMSLGYLPCVLAGFWLVYQGKWWSGAALFGISVSLMFGNNHFQVVYYTIILLVFAGIGLLYAAVKEGTLKNFFIATAIVIVAGLLGAATNLPSILSTQEYAKETMRGGQSELSSHDKGKKNGGLDKEYAFRWSNSVGETFTLMVPYLYGGSDQEPGEHAPKTAEAVGSDSGLPMYWGPQPLLQGPVYFGAAICFLFLLGMMLIRSRHKWWILAVCVLSILMSLGKNLPSLNYFLFDTLPMLNKFRAPTMILILPQLLFPMVGIWVIQEIIDRKEKESAEIWKNIKIAAIITAGICLVLGILGSAFFNYTGGMDAQLQPELVRLLKEDRASLVTKSSLISALYILLTAGAIWAYIKNKIQLNMLLGAIGLIIAIDLIPVANNYLGSNKYEDLPDYAAYFDQELDRRHCKEAYFTILKDKDPYFRVFDISEKNPYNDAVQAYYFKCVGGYHPAKMEAYQDLIDVHMSNSMNAQVLNMLNTKYIIVKQDPRASAGVIPNPNACGNAWFVDEIKWAATADEEMASLNAASFGDTSTMMSGFDPKKTAVIRNTFKEQLNGYNFGKDSAATVQLTQYGLDDLSFVSSNNKDGLAVFSDMYYAHGWKAYVDGKETPIVKANYVLRAIKIPAGQHKIEFHFRPESFAKGGNIALVSSILILGLALGALYQAFRKQGVAEQK